MGAEVVAGVGCWGREVGARARAGAKQVADKSCTAQRMTSAVPFNTPPPMRSHLFCPSSLPLSAPPPPPQCKVQHMGAGRTDGQEGALGVGGRHVARGGSSREAVGANVAQPGGVEPRSALAVCIQVEPVPAAHGGGGGRHVGRVHCTPPPSPGHIRPLPGHLELSHPSPRHMHPFHPTPRRMHPSHSTAAQCLPVVLPQLEDAVPLQVRRALHVPVGAEQGHLLKWGGDAACRVGGGGAGAGELCV